MSSVRFSDFEAGIQIAAILPDGALTCVTYEVR